MKYTALDIIDIRLQAQEKVIADYKQLLARKTDEELKETCQQKGIEVRQSAFANRCALILAKKNALHHFELQVRKHELESLGEGLFRQKGLRKG